MAAVDVDVRFLYQFSRDELVRKFVTIAIEQVREGKLAEAKSWFLAARDVTAWVDGSLEIDVAQVWDFDRWLRWVQSREQIT